VNNNERNCLEMLEVMLQDMQKADLLSAPTDFWGVGVERIVDEINEKGLSAFRAHQSANAFFVPLYSRPFYRSHREFIDPVLSCLDTMPYRLAGTDIANLLTGRTDALADYRVFRAADSNKPPMLAQLSESDAGRPLEHFSFDNCNYSLSFLNYLKGLAFLKKHLQPGTIKRTLEIGGGFGTLGEIMLKADANALYVDIDLPPVAAVATYYLREVFNEVLAAA
jgi:putative sugar O-methyltransferase